VMRGGLLVRGRRRFGGGGSHMPIEMSAGLRGTVSVCVFEVLGGT